MMTKSADVFSRRGTVKIRPRASTALQERAERSKRIAYIICLIISFCLFLLVRGHGKSTLFWIPAALVVAGLVISVFMAATPTTIQSTVPFFNRIAGNLLQVTTAAAGLLAFLDIVYDSSILWPSALVFLFSSRIFAGLADQRFAVAWRAPLQPRSHLASQSIAAALMLGGFFALAIEQAFLLTSGFGSSAVNADNNAMTMEIISEALRGDTIVHRALLYLFFVVVALIVDAWRLHRRDANTLAAIVQQLRIAGKTGSDLRTILCVALENNPGARSLLRCLSIIEARPDGAQSSPKSTAPTAFRARIELDRASRKFLQGLVPLLPLLGFLGTVIGLSITLSQLPQDSAHAGRVAIDISASLGGLAIKFQTTLLGLAGGMIASTAIAMLEKSESELDAECGLIVSAALSKEAGHAS